MYYSDFNSLKNDENTYLMQAYARYNVAFVKGEGATLWDIEGKKYIDLSSGIGVCSLGYGNKKITEAITNQSKNLMHISNLFYTEPVVTCAKKLVENSHFKKAFFANSGAEANECAIKIARKYSTDNYGTHRTKIITLNNSFHGRTITTLSATGQDKFHKYFYPFTNGFAYVNANAIEQLSVWADETTCAIMIELIQGEGGVLPLDKEYVQSVYNLCKERDILLIVDEVQTGIGRTGKLFCFENYDIKPNIVSLAKGLGGGLPIGAVLADEKCKNVITAGTHGTTFGGNPLATVCANVVLDEVINDEFLNEVCKKGEYIRNKIKEFGTREIKEIRGIGLMIGLCVGEGKQAEYAKKLIENGVIVLTAGKDTIRLLPPLTITYEEIDTALEIMKGVF